MSYGVSQRALTALGLPSHLRSHSLTPCGRIWTARKQHRILPLPLELPPQSGDAGLRAGPSTIGQMNRQGLYWPTDRNLFRRRSLTGGRVALWIVVAALIAAWVSGHIQ